MHGMICKTLEAFLRDRRGDAVWEEVRAAAGAPVPGFEAMRRYPDALATAALRAAARRLDLREAVLLDDIGTWLCTYPPLDALRRLIRFSGPDFTDLVWALEDLQDRAHLALPDLGLPACRVRERGGGRFYVWTRWRLPGAAPVLAGMLRAMADDHGVLASVELAGRRPAGGIWIERLRIALHDPGFAPPRHVGFGSPP